MFAHLDPQTSTMIYPALELVRLAISCRVYTQAHIDYVAETAAKITNHKDSLRGFKFTYAPEFLRHITARFEPL
jgi:tryptophanase